MVYTGQRNHQRQVGGFPRPAVEHPPGEAPLRLLLLRQDIPSQMLVHDLLDGQIEVVPIVYILGMTDSL